MLVLGLTRTNGVLLEKDGKVIARIRRHETDRFKIVIEAPRSVKVKREKR